MLISDGINHGKLQGIIVEELRKAGLKHRLKKITSKNVKDSCTVFGAPLMKVPSCSVICCGSTLCIPNVVSEMSAILRHNVHVEGLFRKAGSQARQKDIKKLLDSGGRVTESHHPIDVASVLKLYLRCLPEPLISAEVQDLLLRCRITAGEDALRPILHTLLLLPVLHVHLLHYVMELLNFVASRHKDNLMDANNLAIVLAPSIMPLPAAATTQRLEHHVSIIKMFIENSKYIGILTDDLMMQLDDDSDLYLARRKKRRSGSINRVLSGIRKMVTASVNTPATLKENSKTPVISKSAAKRKYDGYEGLSAKTKKQIKQILPQHELSATPMKIGFDRKRLRLSLIEATTTPNSSGQISRDNLDHSNSSEDLLTSSENLSNGRETIDVSPDYETVDKDYVKISKQEYEAIKSRVSAIESRLSRDFTPDPLKVEPLQEVQNVYKQTLEEVAMLDCTSSDHLARRLSKELKIRPEQQAKIIRSPSARKIGNIRRRSQENITKLVRHKSWNITTQSQTSHNIDRFYPYPEITRIRTHPINTETQRNAVFNSDSGRSDKGVSNKYSFRKRTSYNSDNSLNKTIGKVYPQRSFTASNNSSWNSMNVDSSANNTLDSSTKSDDIKHSGGKTSNRTEQIKTQKWKSAAAFFIDKTGEETNISQSGRPSVNRIRRQNAGAVLAKAKMFETSSSDKSSEKADKEPRIAFARNPRISGQFVRKQDIAPRVPPRMSRYSVDNVGPAVPARPASTYVNIDINSRRIPRKTTPPVKKRSSPQITLKTPETGPHLKKPLCTPRTLRSPAVTADGRRANTPMKAVHVSPKRRSPRQKLHRFIN